MRKMSYLYQDEAASSAGNGGQKKHAESDRAQVRVRVRVRVRPAGIVHACR